MDLFPKRGKSELSFPALGKLLKVEALIDCESAILKEILDFLASWDTDRKRNMLSVN